MGESREMCTMTVALAASFLVPALLSSCAEDGEQSICEVLDGRPWSGVMQSCGELPDEQAWASASYVEFTPRLDESRGCVELDVGKLGVLDAEALLTCIPSSNAIEEDQDWCAPRLSADFYSDAIPGTDILALSVRPSTYLPLDGTSGSSSRTTIGAGPSLPPHLTGIIVPTEGGCYNFVAFPREGG